MYIIYVFCLFSVYLCACFLLNSSSPINSLIINHNLRRRKQNLKAAEINLLLLLWFSSVKRVGNRLKFFIKIRSSCYLLPLLIISAKIKWVVTLFSVKVHNLVLMQKLNLSRNKFRPITNFLKSKNEDNWLLSIFRNPFFPKIFFLKLYLADTFYFSW